MRSKTPLPWLDSDDPFPAVSLAWPSNSGAPGLLAAGGDLSVPRLISAYRQGIFPWFSQRQPILWFSTDPRMVLQPQNLKISRSLAKRLRNTAYEIRFDNAFEQVLEGCAAPRNGHAGTWITPEMHQAYITLHRQGYAHSVETWIHGELAGGLYGVALGGVFFGESMFTRITDASKLALVHLVRICQAKAINLIDCQFHTPHLESLGAREISREHFLRYLDELIHNSSKVEPWSTANLTNDVRS